MSQLPAHTEEDRLLDAYVAQHFGASYVDESPLSTAPTADPALGAEPDPQADEEALLDAYAAQHFPG